MTKERAKEELHCPVAVNNEASTYTEEKELCQTVKKPKPYCPSCF